MLAEAQSRMIVQQLSQRRGIVFCADPKFDILASKPRSDLETEVVGEVRRLEAAVWAEGPPFSRLPGASVAEVP